jgi:hypothetical protein
MGWRKVPQEYFNKLLGGGNAVFYILPYVIILRDVIQRLNRDVLYHSDSIIFSLKLSEYVM